MKKLAGILAFASLAAATAAYAGLPARTGVNGSIHDMNIYTGSTPDVYGRVCVFCHTPHNAQKDPNSPDVFPLWNHEFTAQTWQQYEWATPENTVLNVADPLTGPSRLCMSCHDGALAVDQHGPAMSYGGTYPSAVLSGNRAIGAGGDLTDDHPIGFDYTAAVTARNTADLNTGELVTIDQPFATSITASATQGTYNTVTRAGGRTIGDVLYGGTIMTCASCHEVHNKENASQDVGTDGTTPNYLLYAKEKDSLICLSCHIK